MEHVVVSHIMKHLQSYNILTDTQYGFRSQHSCESQLLITINDLARALNNRLQIIEFWTLQKHLIQKCDWKEYKTLKCKIRN